MKAILPALLFLAGCGLFGKRGRLPEVWVIPELTIRLYAALPQGDPKIEEVKKLLVRMNQKIYDATDGQVRIAKFVIVNPARISEWAFGVGNLYTKEACPS